MSRFVLAALAPALIGTAALAQTPDPHAGHAMPAKPAQAVNPHAGHTQPAEPARSSTETVSARRAIT